MDSLPFKLNFLKQVEIFQDLVDLDSHFDKQLNRVIDKKGKNYPTWYFEKKILYYAFEQHLHLGSDISIKQFQCFVNTGEGMAGGTWVKSSEDEKSLNAYQNGIHPGIHNEKNESIPFTHEEIEKVQIRKVFGSLVAKGFAVFPAQTMARPNPAGGYDYFPIPVDQENACGVLITEKGFEYGRMIYKLYSYQGKLLPIPGVQKVLSDNKKIFSIFRTLVKVSWILLALTIALLIFTLANQIKQFITTDSDSVSYGYGVKLDNK